MVKQIKYIIITILFSVKSFSQYKQHLTFHKAEVLKNTKRNIFQIKFNKKVIYDELKFVAYAETSLQILNDKNELFYLDEKLNKIPYPKKVDALYCGTVDDFLVKIIEKDKYYLIEKTIDPIDSRATIKKEIIDSISKKNIKDIYFLTRKRIIKYDENFFFPETLIIETKDGKRGIRLNGEVTKYYDEIDFTNPSRVKIRKNKLWGYYTITAIKYRVLNKYVFNLASFELENGNKGFVDYKGNEYLE